MKRKSKYFSGHNVAINLWNKRKRFIISSILIPLAIVIVGGIIVGLVIAPSPPMWLQSHVSDTHNIDQKSNMNQSTDSNVSARIDKFIPSSADQAPRIEVGNTVEIGVVLTNTGIVSWKFTIGASIWDSKGNLVRNYEQTLDSYLYPGDTNTITWQHIVNAVDEYWIQFAVWKAKPFDKTNLLDKQPVPSQMLIIGIPPK
jgi:hypothetical protein